MTSSERMQELLLSQFYEKPVIYAILKVIGVEFDILENVIADLNTKIYPATANGAQLDLCGEVADISRYVDDALPAEFFGFPDHGGFTFDEAPFRRLYDGYYSTNKMNDSTYRLLINAKIAKNITNGSRIDTINSLRKVFGTEYVTVRNSGNAKANVGIGRKLTKNERLLIERIDLIVRGAGIGVKYLYWYKGGNCFGFTRKGRNVAGFKGMGVGFFARLITVTGGATA